MVVRGWFSLMLKSFGSAFSDYLTIHVLCVLFCFLPFFFFSQLLSMMVNFETSVKFEAIERMYCFTGISLRIFDSVFSSYLVYLSACLSLSLSIYIYIYACVMRKERDREFLGFSSNIYTIKSTERQ